MIFLKYTAKPHIKRYERLLIPIGKPTTTSFIETVIIATKSHTARFGDLQATNVNAGGNAATTSPTRAVFCGGQAPSDTNMMQHIEMASGGTATDFGDLVRAQRGGATTSSGHGGLG